MSRRRFLQQTSALGAASLLGISGESRAEPPPEVRKIRIVLAEAMCMAPQYMAEELLLAEGFDEVEYVPIRAASGTYSKVWIPDMLCDGVADLSMGSVPGMVWAIDRGGPVVVIGGIHAGCYELFGHGEVQSIRALKGRTIVGAQSGDEQLFVSSMMAYVGMDPNKDVKWITGTSLEESMQLFIDKKADAYLGFPPHPQELRARKIGRMVLSTATDRPWSQYFCCIVAGNREFVRSHPVATKRALRAILKAADICAREPERAARYMVEKGYVRDMKYALGLMSDLPYDRWRKSDPEDTLRFYALRLHEVGVVRTSPAKIIERGTDWRFINELKKEMKA